MIVEVKNLTKKYGNHTAVSDLSFEIEKGKIYGFLGPNGAGKSTTMNIMTGCLAATKGEVLIGGFDIFEQPVQAKKLIGYLPELPPLYTDRTPREYLKFVAEAKGVKGKEIAAQVKEVMEETQITDVADRIIKNLSKGYKQRVGIAQALLGNPEVIILDEPTVGLDPRQIIEIRDLIKELGKNHTVILSSHILSEVQAVCETIMIISKGKMVACDTPENLEKMFSGSISVNLTVEATKSEVKNILKKVKDIKNIEITEDGKVCHVVIETNSDDDSEICKNIFFAFAEAKKAILKMNPSSASLEEIFLELTDRDEEPDEESEDDEDTEEINDEEGKEENE